MKRTILLLCLLTFVLIGCSQEDDTEGETPEISDEFAQQENNEEANNKEESNEEEFNEEENIDDAEVSSETDQGDEEHPYVGMWVTENDRVRLELLPTGRYDEAVGRRESAYQSNYTIDSNQIHFVDDSGFTVNDEFRDGALYLAQMVLYREE